MEEKKPTIEDLLRKIKVTRSNTNDSPTLKNTKETWKRIGNKDTFDELGFSSSELDSFLKEWVSENPYSAI